MRARYFCCLGAILAMLPGVLPAQSAFDRPRVPQGQAVIQVTGQAIESITLVAEEGNGRQITLPGGRSRLPPGRYRLQMIQLKGGYYAMMLGDEEWFTLSPGKPHVLRAGAPLTAHVAAVRQGRLLELNYELRDPAGRSYSPLRSDLRPSPPEFTILRDGQTIHSGAFQYG